MAHYRSSSDRHHAGHGGEKVVHLFATGAWAHDAFYAM